MPKRWSKLQAKIEDLMDDSVNFKIHMAKYRMNALNSHYNGERLLPRYWITINGEIVFDYPRQFDTTLIYGSNSYPWDRETSQISAVIEQYIDCPLSEIMNPFSEDKWGITDILRVCDRRIGKRRLSVLRDSIEDEVLLDIINLRLLDN